MSTLRFFKKYHDGHEVEVSKEEALESLLTIYKDNDMTRDMLTVVNVIPGIYWNLEVKEVKA